MSLPEKASQAVNDHSSSPGAEKVRVMRQFTILAGALTAAASTGLIILAVNQPSWQLRILALAYAACSGFAILAGYRLYPQKRMLPGLSGFSLIFAIALLASAALIGGLGFPAAIVLLIFALTLSTSMPREWQADLIITLGILSAGLCALLTEFSPFAQVTIFLNPIFVPAVLVGVILAYIVMLTRQLIPATLHTRLISALLGILIVLLTLLPVIQSRFVFDVFDDQLNQSLLQSAQHTALEIDRYLADQQRAVSTAAQVDLFARYLELPIEQRSDSPEEQETLAALRILNARDASSAGPSSYALLDLEGNPLMGERSGGDLAPEARTPPAEVSISPVLLPTPAQGFFYIDAPVKNARNQVLGVLRARYDGLLLQDLLLRFKGLAGENSAAILLDENNIRLGDSFTPEFIYRSVAPLADAKTQTLKENRRLPDLPNPLLATDFEKFDQAVNNYETQPFFLANIEPVQAGAEPVDEIGAIAPLESMPWKVVYLQANFSQAALQRSQHKITASLTGLAVMLAGLTALGLTRLLSRPVDRLASAARRISAGDLSARAPAQSLDEFGLLGTTVNALTSQLRALKSQLGEWIQTRTIEIENQNQALTHRAHQLETVSEVARQIVSAQELETLLTSVTHLISERFGFYHVGIFLLDDNHEYAVLRAANSPGGQRMLARRHMLPVSKVGIVGAATGTGQVHIAKDVGEDAAYFDNPDLPDTRSEMALPLIVSGQIIGALDIQSTAPDAFQNEDIDLFRTLADQVAVAIYNNRLYINTLNALNEAENLHRQYLQSEWAQDTARRKVLGYVYNQTGIAPQESEDPLWKKVFSTGDPVYAVLPDNHNSVDKAIMAVPIAIRGETIGVIQVQDQGEERRWSDDEITVVNSIASQVAVALENARLFENTVRRADREKKVMEITAKIRSTTDPNEMMKIAVSELQQALRATRTQIYVRQNGEGVEQPLDNPGAESSTSQRASE